MHARDLPPILLTDADIDRLYDALESAEGPARPPLGARRVFAELERAQVVPPSQIPADVATMNARVRYRDLDTGNEREVTLCYPADADPRSGRLSVLSPIGAALLGLRVGQRIRWAVPSGDSVGLELLAVPYQPEAAGDFDR